MPPRFHVDLPLAGAAEITLPEGAARHVQVLRLQPGDALTLFDGRGGEWMAEVTAMGRREVSVRIGAHANVSRELPLAVTLAVGMPANERMDALVEKACELGVAAIQPLLCERSVLRTAGERAQKKVAHWQGVAVAACEQSGRTRVPTVAPVMALPQWLASLGPRGDAVRIVLSLRDAHPLPALRQLREMISLSGPEGGLSAAEEDSARRCGFQAASLGARTLRADTAPLALLAHVGLTTEGLA
ncbi:16S rRNA (uracil(1498)-N(3))-methyltransferase [Piscinibacter aquaticus]|uniref:Ribosomal RNA small subunit methyltransferase E n=1 Tax=Piscinibacter aquaticus TaxID=392597 RepID=A0A5C6U276_9BURK|nr:16S rRNA (uracil(1498)-N(3))-methyltransferase [Piscinibacter aquaticus]